jgi:membrane fusion protein (multidrug efflux system)
VELSVDALPGRSFKGRVEAVDSQVDANGRALQVLAKVDNPGALLKPGMFARPRVVFSVREGAVVVPEEALVPLGNKQLLFKVVDGAPGQKVAQRWKPRWGCACRARWRFWKAWRLVTCWSRPAMRGCCAATGCRCGPST